MPFRQLTAPNINVPAFRGWCLEYVDDAVNASNANRQKSATNAWNAEKSNGHTQTGEPPIGIWFPIFFSLPKYPQGDLGHVAWAYNHGAGWIEIHDSETQPGARPVYRSIAEVTAWFGRFGCTYLGWSTWVDGVHVAEEYVVPPTPTPAPTQGLQSAKGTATITAASLPICNAPTQASPAIAWYVRGQSFNYDAYQVSDGFVWLSYISNSGVRRYVAEGPNDGNSKNTWVSGGVG